MKGQFGGLITAMVTPFDADGRVELGTAQKIAAWLLDNGSEGLVVAGTTGEGPTLTDQEKAGLWRAVVEAVGDRGSVIAGSGTNDTAHSIHLTREAEKAGCHAALVVTVPLNSCSWPNRLCVQRRPTQVRASCPVGRRCIWK